MGGDVCCHSGAFLSGLAVLSKEVRQEEKGYFCMRGAGTDDKDKNRPWWSDAVVYEIYPRSFMDANGDGVGDLVGVAQRLDYLADLGVDVIWLCPIYCSPQIDNGYDVSDYQTVDPIFGNMKDLDLLVTRAHAKGMKVILDMVLNHTSDQHRWFQASRRKDGGYEDWYWWRPARSGCEPGKPGSEPNRWASHFGGSAWECDPVRGEYYLHIFSPHQPDLNWENPEVRRALYDMMNWWMNRGIDGFRLDTITLISKTMDEKGRLPGEEDSELSEGPVDELGYSELEGYCQDGPRLDAFLREMHGQVFAGRSGYLNVGESGVTPDRYAQITDPECQELDMLFVFDHMNIDRSPRDAWSAVPFRLPALKRKIKAFQMAVRHRGWPTVFFDNHDQPRALSRWCGLGTKVDRVLSAKALCILLLTHRGTPFIYQGDELGMTNASFSRIDQYRDPVSMRAYGESLMESGRNDKEGMLRSLSKFSRDNARTPMQWDSSEYAGFMGKRTVCEPWIEVNPNHAWINARAEMRDSQSVLCFYKRLITIRHRSEALCLGDWRLLDEDDERIYAYLRTFGEEDLLVIVNFSGEDAPLTTQTRGLIKDYRNILISSYDKEETQSALRATTMKSWMGCVLGTEPQQG